MNQSNDIGALSEKGFWERQFTYRSSAFYFLFRTVVFTLNFPYNELFRIIRKTVGGLRDKTMMEIGCAPGFTLVDFQRRFGIIPSGIEYTKSGFTLTRKLFRRRGIPAESVVQEDIFSDSFLESNRSRFDIVASFGLIEHYDDPRKLIRRHVDLLKASGLLILMIPNLRKMNGAIQNFFDPKVLSLHNVKIMDRHSFKELVPEEAVETLFCDYYGAINLGLYNTDSPFKTVALMVFHLVQLLCINPLFFLLGALGVRRNGDFCSPYLLFIGRKRGRSQNGEERSS
jgi:SAM-dependent methyltransferase